MCYREIFDCVPRAIGRYRRIERQLASAGVATSTATTSQ